MRDLILIVLLGGALPFAFLRPWFGIILWCLVSMMAPHKMGWALASAPVADVVALATVAGFLLFREGTRSIALRLPGLLMLALWLWTGVTTVFALRPDAAQQVLAANSKMLLFVFLSIALFQDLRRLKWLLGGLVGGLGLYACKGALFSVLGGAQDIVFGPNYTHFEDNNHFALALTMLLPLALFLMRSAGGFKSRWFWAAMAAGLVLSTLFTYSRGGVLALSAVLGVTILRSRQRVPAMAVAVFVILAVAVMAPAAWMARVESIGTYDQDRSVSGRFNAWGYSWNLAVARPLVGGGFAAFTPELYRVYGPEPEPVLVSHSIYFHMLATQGFVGLGLYLALLGAMLWRTGRLRRRAGRLGAAWFAGCADAIQLATVAYMVGGAFLSMPWNEIFYHLVAIQVVLEVLSEPLVAAQPQAHQPAWRREPLTCAA